MSAPPSGAVLRVSRVPPQRLRRTTATSAAATTAAPAAVASVTRRCCRGEMVTGKRCSEWRGLYPSGYCYRHVDQGPYEARMLLRGLRHPGEPKPAAVRYSTVVENSGAVYIAQEVVVRTRGEDLWHLKVGITERSVRERLAEIERLNHAHVPRGSSVWMFNVCSITNVPEPRLVERGLFAQLEPYRLWLDRATGGTEFLGCDAATAVAALGTVLHAVHDRWDASWMRHSRVTLGCARFPGTQEHLQAFREASGLKKSRLKVHLIS